MDQYFSQILGMPVVDNNDDIIGRIFNLIIDPSTGKLVALALSPGLKRVVSPVDIIEWNKHIQIHDIEDIIEADEIQQVKEIKHKNIQIYRNRVVTKDGQYLGRVMDFAIDNKFFRLSKLFVAKLFLGFFPYQKRVIEAHEIVEMHRKAIIVKNDREAIRLKRFQMDMAPSN